MKRRNRTFETVSKSIFKFTSLTNARSFSYRTEKASLVILGDHDGDNGQYWVALLGDAEWLIKNGYEVAR